MAILLGVLVWAVGFGVALHHASDKTKSVLHDLSEGVSRVVMFIVRLAPIGIFVLVANTIADSGFDALVGYAQLLTVLLSEMLIVALIVNPLLVYVKTHRNPYPLVLRCLRESGVTAFFMRSSAAIFR